MTSFCSAETSRLFHLEVYTSFCSAETSRLFHLEVYFPPNVAKTSDQSLKKYIILFYAILYQHYAIHPTTFFLLLFFFFFSIHIS